MTILSILLALIVERVMPQTIELRRFDWLRGYNQWLDGVLHIGSLGAWGSFAVILLPLLMVAWLLTGIFENALFGLFELVFNVAVVFFCLGPADLDKQVDRYIDAIEVGDEAQRTAAARGLLGQSPAEVLGEQLRQVCGAIFSEANGRIYAVLFWFALFGPLAAVAYRVVEQLMSAPLLPAALENVRQVCRSLLGWIDWLPARLTLFAFMISGSFEDAQQAFRQGALRAADSYEQNRELLQNVGLRAISSAVENNDAQQAMQTVRKARGLVLRALVVWLLLILFYSVFE